MDCEAVKTTYIVTLIENGDREIRKATTHEDDAWRYARTVPKLKLPEVWKKVERKRDENSS